MRKLLLLWLFASIVATGKSLAWAQYGRLEITHGPISGEVNTTSVVLWARGSGEGTLTFTVAEKPDFKKKTQTCSVRVAEESDFTGKAKIKGLSARTTYYYRVTLHSKGKESKSVQGQFSTAPSSDKKAAFRFVFGTCLGGQGHCRNPDTGWDIFAAMSKMEPDFFLMLGDAIYSDWTCPSEDGKNVPGAETVATDLEGFRNRYRYHLDDTAYQNFLTKTPVFVTWDDHEIVNNFGGPSLKKCNPKLFKEGRQAYFEYWPLNGTEDEPYRIYRTFSYGAHADFFILDTRSYRDPIVYWDTDPQTGAPKTMLGKEQLDWLKSVLRKSKATWKFILTSVPLSYPTGGRHARMEGRDGWADGGDRSGYETELMSLMFYITNHHIDNVVFLTGDTHHPFAMSYDPDRDGQVDFLEFGSSPLSASLATPKKTDQTFNPTVLYEEGALYNFGVVGVSARGNLTFRVIDKDGKERFLTALEPR